MELWTHKYKPGKMSEILSQGTAVSEALRFVETWKPGKALFLYGPPGTGKTLIPEVIAKEKKWMLLQVNASDKRNSEAIEESLTEGSKNTSLFHSSKIILIDEVDGLSSGDRGGQSGGDRAAGWDGSSTIASSERFLCKTDLPTDPPRRSC